MKKAPCPHSAEYSDLKANTRSMLGVCGSEGWKEGGIAHELEHLLRMQKISGSIRSSLSR